MEPRKRLQVIKRSRDVMEASHGRLMLRCGEAPHIQTLGLCHPQFGRPSDPFLTRCKTGKVAWVIPSLDSRNQNPGWETSSRMLQSQTMALFSSRHTPRPLLHLSLGPCSGLPSLHDLEIDLPTYIPSRSPVLHADCAPCLSLYNAALAAPLLTASPRPLPPDIPSNIAQHHALAGHARGSPTAESGPAVPARPHGRKARKPAAASPRLPPSS